MRGLRGEFLGFTYANTHSSALGITRTQQGFSKKSLAPTTKDLTLQIENSNESLYFGTLHTQRVISISFSFEHISDKQLNRIKQIWNTQEIHELIFDEEPHKIYMAKADGKPTINFVCFNGPNNTRYYNGDGVFKFVCFFPYAKSRFPYLENYIQENIPEWTIEEQVEEILSLAGNKDVVDRFAQINYPVASGTDLTVDDFEAQENFPGGVYSNIDNIENLTEMAPSYVSIYEQYIVNGWKNYSEIPSLAEGCGLIRADEKKLKYIVNNTGDVNAIVGIWLDLRSVNQAAFNREGIFTLNFTLTCNDQKQMFTIKGLSVLYETINGEKVYDDYLYIDFYRCWIQGYKLNNNIKKVTTHLYNGCVEGAFLTFSAGEKNVLECAFTREDQYQSLYNFDLATLNPKVEVTYLYE